MCAIYAKFEILGTLRQNTPFNDKNLHEEHCQIQQSDAVYYTLSLAALFHNIIWKKFPCHQIN